MQRQQTNKEKPYVGSGLQDQQVDSTDTEISWKVTITSLDGRKLSNSPRFIKPGVTINAVEAASYCDESEKLYIENLRKTDREAFRRFYNGIEGVLFSRDVRTNPVTGIRSVKFLCYFCQQTLYSYARIKYHINNHLNLKPYECDVCGKRYTNPSSIYSHRANNHKK